MIYLVLPSALNSLVILLEALTGYFRYRRAKEEICYSYHIILGLFTLNQLLKLDFRRQDLLAKQRGIRINSPSTYSMYSRATGLTIKS